LRRQDKPGGDEPVPQLGPARLGRSDATGERKVPIAALVSGGQAELGLHGALERRRGFLGVAPMPGVDSVDRHTALCGEPQQRADPIHGLEDSKKLRRNLHRGCKK
jgi:hypothetical protein